MQPTHPPVRHARQRVEANHAVERRALHMRAEEVQGAVSRLFYGTNVALRVNELRQNLPPQYQKRFDEERQRQTNYDRRGAPELVAAREKDAALLKLLADTSAAASAQRVSTTLNLSGSVTSALTTATFPRKEPKPTSRHVSPPRALRPTAKPSSLSPTRNRSSSPPKKNVVVAPPSSLSSSPPRRRGDEADEKVARQQHFSSSGSMFSGMNDQHQSNSQQHQLRDQPATAAIDPPLVDGDADASVDDSSLYFNGKKHLDEVVEIYAKAHEEAVMHINSNYAYVPQRGGEHHRTLARRFVGAPREADRFVPAPLPLHAGAVSQALTRHLDEEAATVPDGRNNAVFRRLTKPKRTLNFGRAQIVVTALRDIVLSPDEDGATNSGIKHDPGNNSDTVANGFAHHNSIMSLQQQQQQPRGDVRDGIGFSSNMTLNRGKSVGIGKTAATGVVSPPRRNPSPYQQQQEPKVVGAGAALRSGGSPLQRLEQQQQRREVTAAIRDANSKSPVAARNGALPKRGTVSGTTSPSNRAQGSRNMIPDSDHPVAVAVAAEKSTAAPARPAATVSPFMSRAPTQDIAASSSARPHFAGARSPTQRSSRGAADSRRPQPQHRQHPHRTISGRESAMLSAPAYHHPAGKRGVVPGAHGGKSQPAAAAAAAAAAASPSYSPRKQPLVPHPPSTGSRVSLPAASARRAGEQDDAAAGPRGPTATVSEVTLSGESSSDNNNGSKMGNIRHVKIITDDDKDNNSNEAEREMAALRFRTQSAALELRALDSIDADEQNEAAAFARLLELHVKECETAEHKCREREMATEENQRGRNDMINDEVSYRRDIWNKETTIWIGAAKKFVQETEMELRDALFDVFQVSLSEIADRMSEAAMRVKRGSVRPVTTEEQRRERTVAHERERDEQQRQREARELERIAAEEARRNAEHRAIVAARHRQDLLFDAERDARSHLTNFEGTLRAQAILLEEQQRPKKVETRASIAWTSIDVENAEFTLREESVNPSPSAAAAAAAAFAPETIRAVREDQQSDEDRVRSERSSLARSIAELAIASALKCRATSAVAAFVIPTDHSKTVGAKEEEEEELDFGDIEETDRQQKPQQPGPDDSVSETSNSDFEFSLS